MSPYAAAFKAALGEPGLKVEDVFKQVWESVQRETYKQQLPWEQSSLIGDFYFKAGKEQPKANPSLVAEVECFRAGKVWTGGWCLRRRER